jgi:hypothetical protein
MGHPMHENNTNFKPPSQRIRDGLNSLLANTGSLQLFADKYNFKFGSLYKIAKGKIGQPGVDYGFQLLEALKKEGIEK